MIRPLISIITVNYNGAKYTCEMIQSLKNITYPSVEIIVVDNASSESLLEIKEKYPDVILVQSEKNLGFAGGNNLGISVSNGDYILLLNNDTEVHELFLEPLVDMLESDIGIGAVSPKVLYYNTNIIQYAGSIPMSKITGKGGFLGDKEIDNGQYDKQTICSHTHGAAMLIPKRVIEKVGLMPECYFLYYEELDYCEMIKRAGYSLWYVPNSIVYHKESMSVGKLSTLKIYYITRNRILYMKRNVSVFYFLFFCIYYLFVSFPKNVFKYIVADDFCSLKAYLKGISWHFNLG